MDSLQPEHLVKWPNRESQNNRGAIGVGEDGPLPASILLLVRNDVQVLRVELRDHQRNIGIHAVILGIGKHPVSRLGESLFNVSGH